MKVVVVCCVRNEEETISKMLRTLINQTIVPEKIVIVNDGSINGTVQELVKWKNAFPSKIVIITRNDRIGGENLAGTPEMAQAFNVAFKYIEKEDLEYDYLMVCGADDEYPQEYLERLISKMIVDPLIVMASGRVSSRKIYSRTSPRGAGRLIRKDYWLEYGQRYVYPSFYWETKCLMIAQMKGYKTVAFYDVVFKTRKQGSIYGHYRYGVMHRSINYPMLSVLKYVGLLFLRFKWRGVINYLIGYSKHPTRIIPEDRQLSEDFLKWKRNK